MFFYPEAIQVVRSLGDVADADLWLVSQFGDVAQAIPLIG